MQNNIAAKDLVRFTSAEFQAHRVFWEATATAIEGPFQLKGNGRGDSQREQYVLEVPDTSAQALNRLVRGNETGLLVCGVTALMVLSRYYTSRNAFVFLSPMLGNHQGVLPIALDGKEGSDLKSLLVIAKQQVSQSFKFQQYPWRLAFQAHQPGFVAEDNDIGIAFHGLTGEFPADSLPALIFRWSKTGADRLSLVLDYDAGSYAGWEVSAIGAHYLNILAAFSNPGVQVDDIAVLQPGEKQHLLESFNPPSSPFAQTVAPGQEFELRVEDLGDAIAIQDEQSKLSYDALNRKTNQLAHHLLDQYQLRPGDRVLMLLDRSVEAVVAMLGINKAGAAYVPVDPAYPAERIQFLIEDVAPSVILIQSWHLEKLELQDIPVFVTDLQLEMLFEPESSPEVDVQDSDPAYIMYTSGSTGQPKGVVVPQRAILRLVCNNRFFTWEPADVLLQGGSLAFDAATFEIWGPLLNGGRLVLANKEALLNADALAEMIDQEGVRVMWFTASLFNRFATEKPTLFGKLRAVLVGGERLSTYHINRVRKSCPGLSIINGYGPTENTTFSICHSIQEDYLHDIPLGSPLSNSRVYILGEQGQLLPPGRTGEICLAGAGLALGYLKRPELTEAVFAADPFVEGERMYRSGDLGMWDEKGLVHYQGRKDSQLKIRGFRVEPGEVEEHLLGHPELTGVYVGKVDTADGYADLAAWYIAGKEFDGDRLRSFLSDRVPEFMIPAWFCRVEALPLTLNGKIDRKALPDPRGGLDGQDYQAPESPLQEVLAAIWEEVLEQKRVGIRDDFFKLGGHSLKAAKVVTMISERLHASIGLVELFECPTIEALTPVVEAALDEGLAPIPALEEAEHYPLSYAQRRLWLLHQQEGGASAYNMPSLTRISGPLDVEALRKAFQALTDRHESLRTCFVMVEGNPRQKILPSLKVELVAEEVTSEASAVALAQELADAPFDLEKAPLFRVRLFRLGEDDHLLLWTMHHILSDARSTVRIISEIQEAYAAFWSGKALTTEPLRIQYKAYAAWHNALLEGEEGRGLQDYWQKQLAGPLPVLNLPTDQVRSSRQNFEGANHEILLPATTATALEKLARAQGTSLFVVLMALTKAFLYRISGQEDMIVGTPIAGRIHPDLEAQIGFYVNSLALRDSVNGSMPYQDLVHQVKETAASAFRHEAYPFDLLVETLGIRPEPGRNPVFDVMLTLNEALLSEGMGNANLGEAVLSAMEVDFDYAKFDLQLNFAQEEQGIRMFWNYRRSLFNQDRIAAWASAFAIFADALLQKPDTAIGEAPMLEPAVREKLLLDFDKRETAWPDTVSLVDLFEAQAHADPDAVALRFDGQGFSYGWLDVQANALAVVLRQNGLEKGDLVGVLCPREPVMLVVIWAILKAGAGYLPIDPDFPASRKQFMMVDSGAVGLVYADGQFPEGNWWVLSAKEALAESEEAFQESVIEKGNGQGHDSDLSPVGRETRPGPEDLAYVIYTSGSTGKPKGVRVMHQNVVRLLFTEAPDYDFAGFDCWTLFHSYTFDFSVWEIFGALLNGSRLVLVPKATTQNPEAFADLLLAEGVTVLNQTPGAFYALADTLLRQLSSGAGTEGASARLQLRYVIFGGDKLTPVRLQAFADHFPEVRLINMYGITETTVHVTFRALSADDFRFSTSNIGYPIPTLSLYVLDQQQRLAAPGVPGELYVGGAGLSAGYLNRPELNAERFPVLAIEGLEAQRLYRTGDLAEYAPGGGLNFLGRIDYQVKIRGHRIELGEVSHRLNLHPAVLDGVVLDREGPRGDTLLAAYYVLEEGAASAPDMRGWLAEGLPAYMVPGWFFPLEKLPLTSNGKLDRRVLLEMQPASVEPDAGFVAPRTGLETKLAAVWADLLGLERVGVKDNFFELGGHSLLATKLVARLHQALDIELPLQVLFRDPTIQAVADWLSGESHNPYASIPAQSDRKIFPLSPAQKRIYVLNQFAPHSTAYNMPAFFRMKGKADVGAFETALKALIQRHVALRTVFRMEKAGPVQEVLEAVPFSLQVESGSEAEGLAWSQEFIRPFELDQAPLFRAGLFRYAPESFLFLFDMHHVISDGETVKLLFRELLQLYRGASLPALRIQYPDFADWQLNHYLPAREETDRDYWLDQFAGEIPVLNLIPDLPRPAVHTFEGAHLNFEFGEEVGRRVREFSTAEGVTPFMLSLSVFYLFLYKYTFQQDYIVGTPVAGRPHADLEPIAGMFVNTLPLRAYPDGNKSFRSFLDAVRQTVVDGLAHQEYPFEALVESLELSRDLSRNPLFDVSFSLMTGEDQDHGKEEGLVFEALDEAWVSAKFDMTFALGLDQHGLHLTIEYSTHLYREETIRAMAIHYRNLLEAVLSRPDLSLDAYRMLDVEDQDSILGVFAHGFRTQGAFPSFLEQFKNLVAQQPDAIAVSDADGALSYKELDAHTDALAHYLLARGLQAEERVALLIPQSNDLIVGMVGILKAGGVFLPIDQEYPAARIAYLLQDSGAVNVISLPGAMEGLLKLEQAHGLHVQLINIRSLDREAQPVSASDRPLPVIHPDQLAYQIYTSGSTGNPKGVLISHQSLANHSQGHARFYGYRASDRVAKFSGVGFDASIVEIFPSLYVGATLEIVPSSIRLDMPALAGFFNSRSVTIAFFPVSIAEEFMEEESSSLRMVLAGGDKMRKYQQRSYRYFNNYGPTEGTVASSWFEVDRSYINIPIGKPVDFASLYVFDGGLNPQPVGVPGELFIGGDNLARGYHGKPGLTADRFVPDPAGSGKRLYRSGDIVRWLPDGNLEFLGRADAQVQIRGYRIEPGEIENQLLSDPQIREAVVLSRMDKAHRSYLVAYLTSGGTLNLKTLKSKLKAALPKYMVPEHLLQLESLPLTANGKLDRKALPDPMENIVRENRYVAPRNETEVFLAGLWVEVLGRDQIGIDDNFFDLGGNSLKAVQLLPKIEAGFPGRVSIAQLFDLATIRQMAAFLDGHESGEDESQEPETITKLDF